MNKLVIFGVGLIGGSLALSLKRSGKALHIVGMGRPGDTLQNALDLGVINEIGSSVEQAMQD
ncbi:MAG: prephenate dehydrogenase/arogenate dehydrogenase family protein, partial [Nitrosomonadales bacterium]|nr:prephenate dehydrogenase/arogenate dehydrogenase family protein [Nitrosomonadales bacterium]